MRLTDRNQYVSNGAGPRENAEQVLRELDLRAGDVIVDIGAGGGWWESRLAERVGEEGIVYAAEIRQSLVEDMKSKFADRPQVRPYLVETDSTGLADDSCDVALFIRVYHHLEGQADYLRHLRDVIKPTGRLVVVDRQLGIPPKDRAHGILPSALFRHADEAGWVPVRNEPIRGGEHYIAIFAQGIPGVSLGLAAEATPAGSPPDAVSPM